MTHLITVILRREPTGPARSGRPDDRLSEPRRVTEYKPTSVAAGILTEAPIGKRDTWITPEPMELNMTSSDQTRVKIRVGADGSIVVPATLSEALGLKERGTCCLRGFATMKFTC